MLADICEAQRLWMLNQRAENPAAARQISDRTMGLIVHTRGQELLELAVLAVQDPQGRVARPGDLTRRLEDAVQQNPLIELRRQSPTHIQQSTNPQLIRTCVHPQGC